MIMAFESRRRALLALCVAALCQLAAVAGQRSTQCACRRVALIWCTGEGCVPPSNRVITACSSIVFVNGAGLDYTIHVQTGSGSLISQVSIAADQKQTELARFDYPSNYRLVVRGTDGSSKRVLVTVRSLPAVCVGYVGYCQDDDIGKRYNPGARWRRNSCTPCQCRARGGGQPQVQCSVDRCGAKTCRGGHQPSVLPGKCCPECPQVCFNSVLRTYMLVGQTWREPCYACRCLEGLPQQIFGQKRCTVSPACPTAPRCPGGVSPIIMKSNNPCCPQRFRCPAVPTVLPTVAWYDCEVDGQVHRHGTFWRAECQSCQCQQGKPFCIRTPCQAPPSCPDGTVPDEVQQPEATCCPVYNGCKVAACTDDTGATRRVGSGWSETCQICRCIAGGVRQCYPRSCLAPRPCPGGQLPLVTGRSGCCDTYSCPDCCFDGGKSYGEGATWSQDACTQCQCTSCGVACTKTATCPAVTCQAEEIAVALPGQCCPSECKKQCPWQCGEQLYALDFTSDFRAENFRLFPRGGRLADLLLVVHGYDFYLWAVGQSASNGFLQFVRTGEASTLAKELQSRGDVILKNATLDTNQAADAPFLLVSVDHVHSVISGAGGIHPSPDWFFGPAGVELCNAATGSWRESITIPMAAHDGGINMGRKYLAKRKDRASPRPVLPISRLRQERAQFNPPFGRTQVPQNVGELRIMRLTDGCPGY